jgi:hypothetical protein
MSRWRELLAVSSFLIVVLQALRSRSDAGDEIASARLRRAVWATGQR